jgi:hypothetical protein
MFLSSKAYTNTPISRRANGSGAAASMAAARYWGAVKLEIARRQGIAIGPGADLRG